jgi:hypothetical protein
LLLTAPELQPRGLQTEIHFHPSEPEHREIAESIVAHYKLNP